MTVFCSYLWRKTFTENSGTFYRHFLLVSAYPQLFLSCLLQWQQGTAGLDWHHQPCRCQPLSCTTAGSCGLSTQVPAAFAPLQHHEAEHGEDFWGWTGQLFCGLWILFAQSLSVEPSGVLDMCDTVDNVCTVLICIIIRLVWLTERGCTTLWGLYFCHYLRNITLQNASYTHMHTLTRGFQTFSHGQSEQLEDHTKRLAQLEQELEDHKAHPPEKNSKAHSMSNYREKEAYLIKEVRRPRTHTFFLFCHQYE